MPETEVYLCRFDTCGNTEKEDEKGNLCCFSCDEREGCPFVCDEIKSGDVDKPSVCCDSELKETEEKAEGVS